jgi:hypothetical protein
MRTQLIGSISLKPNRYWASLPIRSERAFFCIKTGLGLHGPLTSVIDETVTP